MRGTNGFLPNCEYCGRFVNPQKPGCTSWLIYGYMCVEREAYAHIDCSEKHYVKEMARIDSELKKVKP